MLDPPPSSFSTSLLPPSFAPPSIFACCLCSCTHSKSVALLTAAIISPIASTPFNSLCNPLHSLLRSLSPCRPLKKAGLAHGVGPGIIFGVESCCGVQKNAAVAVVGGGRADFGAIFDAFVFFEQFGQDSAVGEAVRSRALTPMSWNCLNSVR